MTRESEHTCHATACSKRVPPSMFMCRQHWFQLPKHMRDAVWMEYVPGQENRMDPTGDPTARDWRTEPDGPGSGDDRYGDVQAQEEAA